MSLHSLQNRIISLGGDANARIKKQKYMSFCAALMNDYNSRKVQLENGQVWQALLNLSNLKPDYDKKTISIDYDSLLEPGDVFKVLDNNTHWMVYLPDLVETAYFKSEIIRCRYTLDIDGKKYWVYFQGPTETDVRWALNHGLTYNELNLSGTIYIKNCEATKNFFSRFKQFKIANHTWETQVVDYISVPGIIEVEIQEFYDNIAKDLPEIKKEKMTINDDETIPNPIVGQKTCGRGCIIGFSIIDEDYSPDTIWKVIGNKNVRIKGTHLEGRICEVEVDECAIGSFTICYGNNTFDVKIDSFRPEILGSIEVYPYERYEYKINSLPGLFSVDNNNLAKIIEQNSNSCIIEIVSGKKGHFNLSFNEYDSDQTFVLPIKIKSL